MGDAGSVRPPIGRCSTRCCPTPPRSPIRFTSCRLANTALDECRRRVQNETLGHRGRKTDPLYRCRRRLVMARRTAQRRGPRQAARPARRRRPEAARCGSPGTPRRSSAQIYDHTDDQLAVELVDRDRPRLRRRPDAARGASARPHHHPLAAPDRRLAPLPRLQRTDRSGQQPHQTRQAGGVRLPTVPPLPDPRPCSTPEHRTGPCSPPSHPAEIRSAHGAAAFARRFERRRGRSSAGRCPSWRQPTIQRSPSVSGRRRLADSAAPQVRPAPARSRGRAPPRQDARLHAHSDTCRQVVLQLRRKIELTRDNGPTGVTSVLDCCWSVGLVWVVIREHSAARAQRPPSHLCES